MTLTDEALTAELAPVVAELFDRHLTNTKEWFPHRLVPWSRGRDIEPDQTWDPADATLSDEVRSALIVDLLTEDNLPYYFETIYNLFGKHEPWGEWARRWTAEEGRHSIVIRDYLHVTQAVDLDELERGRMAQVSRGEVPHPETVCDGLAYVTMQELATKISHRNTGRLLEDKVGYQSSSTTSSTAMPPPLRSRSTPTAWCWPSTARCVDSPCRAPASPTSPPTPSGSLGPRSTTCGSTTTSS